MSFAGRATLAVSPAEGTIVSFIGAPAGQRTLVGAGGAGLSPENRLAFRLRVIHRQCEADRVGLHLAWEGNKSHGGGELVIGAEEFDETLIQVSDRSSLAAADDVVVRLVELHRITAGVIEDVGDDASVTFAPAWE